MIELDVIGTGKVVVVGHRGALAHAPENTIASFEAAKALGSHAFECDVRLTADGAVVVMHDALVDRVTNGSGAVSDLRLAELRALDAGAWYGPEFAGQRIPTIDEVMEAALRLDLDLVLEIKGEPEPPRQLVKLSVEAVANAGWTPRTAVISFHHPCLAWAKEWAPEIATGILYGHGTPDPVSEARLVGASSIRPHHSRVTPKVAEAAHAAGLCLHAWVANEPEHALALAEMGVDSIGTDMPGRIVEALRVAGRLA